MRRLIWGFAGRTYHIVGNLMHWLIYKYLNSLKVLLKLKLWIGENQHSLLCIGIPHLHMWTVALCIYAINVYENGYRLNELKHLMSLVVKTRCQVPQKANTLVPSMFQGLLDIKSIWVQHRVSPEPLNLLLWNFHRMLLIYKTCIWIND